MNLEWHEISYVLYATSEWIQSLRGMWCRHGLRILVHAAPLCDANSSGRSTAVTPKWMWRHRVKDRFQHDHHATGILQKQPNPTTCRRNTNTVPPATDPCSCVAQDEVVHRPLWRKWGSGGGSWRSSVNIVTRLRAWRPAFDSLHRRGRDFLLFATASRMTLGPTQPPIQWVPGALSLGVKRPRRETEHLPPSSAEVKECAELYLHSPICLHGVVLS
jgi:hypothetical protein